MSIIEADRPAVPTFRSTSRPGTTPTTAADATDWGAVAADVAARIAPAAARHDADGTFVHESFDVACDAGLGSALVPTEFGGGGASLVEAGTILTELAKGCPATAVTLSMHYHLVAAQVWRQNSGQSAEAVLRKVADGAILISTGAADWIDSRGRATKVDGGFRVSARKTPSSGARAGTVLVTSIPWADGDADHPGPQVLHCAIPFASEGVTIEETWDSMGLRGTGSDTVVYDDVFVPDAAVSLIRPSGAWHPIWSAALGVAMPLIMSAYRGIAESAAEMAIESARQRGDDPVVATLVGEMTNRRLACADTVDAMLAASDGLRYAPTLDHTARVLARKTTAAEAAIDTVRLALEICGGSAYGRRGGVERLLRDVHGALFHPLPAGRQKPFTGRHLLGLDPVAAS
ncbi:MAG: acyl-CoA dehydrogenase family protein [Actinomycetota bacterium]